MTKFKEYRYPNFPTYALSALINGDYSGLTEEDKANLEDFLTDEFYVEHWDVADRLIFSPHFSTCPEFGLATDCVEVIGYYRA